MLWREGECSKIINFNENWNSKQMFDQINKVKSEIQSNPDMSQ